MNVQIRRLEKQLSEKIRIINELKEENYKLNKIIKEANIFQIVKKKWLE